MTNRLLEKSTQLSSTQERSGGQRSGVVQAWVTDEHTRFERVRELEWRARQIDTEHSIVVDPTRKFQEVLGFGSALTDAACYLISELPAAARKQFLQEVFDPSEMGLSVCRVCMGSSDYARSEYSYDDGTPDPEMRRFSIDHDRGYIPSAPLFWTPRVFVGPQIWAQMTTICLDTGIAAETDNVGSITD